MITRRATLVMVVGFCFYLITLVNVLPSFYYALAWLMAGVLASSLGLAAMSLSGLDCTWEPRRLSSREVIPDQDSETAAPSIVLHFSNRGTLNKTGVIIEISVRDELRKSTFTRSYLLEALVSGKEIATEIHFPNLPRGKYTLSHIRMIGSDVLGLFRISHNIFHEKEAAEKTIRFVVGPALIQLAARGTLPEQAFAWSGTGSTKWGHHSDEIRGIRAYVPGDDLRDVHWASTARQGYLVVKEFARPQEQHMLIMWDGSIEFHRHQDALEWGLRFCASLVNLALEQNMPCSLLCLTANPVLLGDVSNAMPLTYDLMQKTLAGIEADRLTLLTEAIQPYSRFAARYGQLCLITPHNDGASAQTIRRWRANSHSHADLIHININALANIPQNTSKNSISHHQPALTWPYQGDDISFSSARMALAQYVNNHIVR